MYSLRSSGEKSSTQLPGFYVDTHRYSHLGKELRSKQQYMSLSQHPYKTQFGDIKRLTSIWVAIKRGTLLATGLRAYAADPDLQQEWMMVKKVNKMRLAEYIEAMSGVKATFDAMFDVQTKRIHKYKKKLLNILALSIDMTVSR
ncbi:unnamed protein product [Prunus armeniaca]